jgi:integrase
MAGRQAKTVSDFYLPRMLVECETHRYPHRDQVIVLLSFKAGLRAMEIAGLRRWHVITSDGEIDDCIHLENKICKKGSGRTIPMAPELRKAVIELFRKVPGTVEDPLILSERAMRDPEAEMPLCMSPRSIGYFFWRLYRAMGLNGCSSHSGRRTFITKAAKKLQEAGGSLRDVQQLAGHSNLTTTQRYIEGDEEAKRRLVALL